MAEFLLYNAPQSTCSQRVRFVLNAKGLPFEEKRLDLFAGDQLHPDYLKINPNAVVPTLVHDGDAIIDSSVIMEYLEEIVPAPEGRGLVPENAVERAHMRSLMRYIDEVPTPAIRVPSYNLAFVRHFRAMSEEDFLALAESKPLRKEFLLTMGRTGFSEEEMAKAMDRLAKALARMNAAITATGGRWMLGHRLTLADIAIMPVVVRLEDIGLASMWDAMPAVARWLEAIQAHPAYRPTYYFGSLLTEKYPELKRERAAARSALKAG